MPHKEAAQEPRLLYPQISRVEGDVWLQSRQAGEARPVRGPLLLEPGDRVGTGASGKAEILLPQAAVRLYSHTRIRVPYAVEDRAVNSREVEVEEGEALVRVVGAGPFAVSTPGLQLELGPSAEVLIGFRDAMHHALCYKGLALARNLRARDQGPAGLTEGRRLSLDDGAALPYLTRANLPDEWGRWERPGIAFSGVVPLPAGSGR